MSGPWAASIGATVHSQAKGRRGYIDSGDRCFGESVRTLWVSTHHFTAAARRVEGQPQAGGADLATGGIEGATEATEERSAVVQRWLMHPTTTTIPESCLGVCLHDG